MITGKSDTTALAQDASRLDRDELLFSSRALDLWAVFVCIEEELRSIDRQVARRIDGG